MKIKGYKTKDERFTAFIPMVFIELFNFGKQKTLDIGIEFWHTTYFIEIRRKDEN